MLKPYAASSSAEIVNSIQRAQARIRAIIAGSSVPEDPRHAENTLEWLLRLDPEAEEALQIAALAHDIERASKDRKVRREDFDDYDAFKAAHARNGASILREILRECGVAPFIVDEACRLVALHEVGGDPSSDLLKDADGVSFFEVNLPLYFQREGRQETKRRCIWGFRRLSVRMKAMVQHIKYEDEGLTRLLRCAVRSKSDDHSDRSRPAGGWVR